MVLSRMGKLLIAAASTVAAGSILVVVAVVSSLKRRSRLGDDIKHLKSLKGLKDIEQVLQNGVTASLASSVESVEVHDPSLAYFPPLLTILTSLTRLDLSGCSVTYIPFSVSSMTQLKHLSVSRNSLCNLADELGSATNLQSLDLSHNELATLPERLCDLSSLEVCNVMSNGLTQLPSGIGLLTSLKLLGLKSNKLKTLPENFGQLTNLVELFLTDNCLTAFPPGFERLSALVKLQASFNSFESIPEELSQLPRLEMMRVAVCNIASLPPSMTGQLHDSTGMVGCSWSSLAWFSLGGNPACSDAPPSRHGLKEVSTSELLMQEKLGAGASGEVFRAAWDGQAVAVKCFRADVSPDGRTVEEVAIACAVDHVHLTQVRGIIKPEGLEASGLTNASSALVMDICLGVPMAAKPTSAHLLRCKWDPLETISCGFALKVALGVSSALNYLHSVCICHGDVYAHNVLVDTNGHATLCDFGASFCYNKDQRAFWEAMECRAFGLFLLDLVQQVSLDKPKRWVHTEQEAAALAMMQKLQVLCVQAAPAARPKFAEIVGMLEACYN